MSCSGLASGPPPSCAFDLVLQRGLAPIAAKLKNLRNFSRVGGALGMYPPGLHDVLSWSASNNRISHTVVDDMLLNIRRQLVWGSLRLFTFRNALHAEWWASEAHEVVQIAIVEKMVESRLKRKASKRKRDALVWEADERKKGIARRKLVSVDRNQPSRPDAVTPWVSSGRLSRLDTEYSRIGEGPRRRGSTWVKIFMVKHARS